jgi:hypothetical protein
MMGSRIAAALLGVILLSGCTFDGSSTAAPTPAPLTRREEGTWRADLTRARIMERARMYRDEVDRSCVIDVLHAVGMTRSLTWELSLRSGQWRLLGAIDGGPATPVDAGTYYMPQVEGTFASFIKPVEGINYVVYPRILGDQLSMGYVDVTSWRGFLQPKPKCFSEATAIVELTNTFDRVA